MLDRSGAWLGKEQPRQIGKALPRGKRAGLIPGKEPVADFGEGRRLNMGGRRDPTLGAFTDGFLFRKLALRHGFCFVPRLGLTWRVSATGLSRSQASNFANSMDVLSSAILRMRADPDFPSWYPEVFERRWRFAIGRIAAGAQPMNRAVLVDLSRGPISRAIMEAVTGIGGRIGRIAVLVWLTLQYRPTSLTGLVSTAMARYRIKPRR